jgi:GAF domain-containing protein
MALPVTETLPIGAHLSVPIRLQDDRLYGTFCCLSFAPDRSLNERELNMMPAFAELTSQQIDRDLKSPRARREDCAQQNYN